MKIITQYNETGKYIWQGNIGSDGVIPPNTYDGEVNMTTQYHDIANNVPVDMPTRPGPYYDFDYATKQWAVNTSRAWQDVRFKRDKLLAATDWMVTKAMEAGTTIDPAWSAYRQALRDITLQADPQAIVWPTQPAA